MAELNFAEAYAKELAAFERDSQESSAQIREHGNKMQSVLMAAMNQRIPDPMAGLPKEHRDAIAAIDQKLVQFPMLVPYVLQFITEKIAAVSAATQSALGPLPQPPSQ